MALPLGIYFFLAYSLLPSLFIDGMKQVLQQLPNFIDADGTPIQRGANPLELLPEIPIADRPEGSDNRSPIPNFSLDEWAKLSHLKVQLRLLVRSAVGQSSNIQCPNRLRSYVLDRYPTSR